MVLDLNVYLEAIEQDLRDILRAPDEAIAPLYAMMQYHMGWLDENRRPVEGARGKRLRPLMCLLACEAVGREWHGALPAASAIELIHNFTLLHDDIEDRSETRRHRPTVWSLWGIAQAINVGDAMWALARLAPCRLLLRGQTAEIVLEVARRLDEASLHLCQGQYLDLCFEELDKVSLDAYERMIAGKTAALLSASLAIGALLGGASPGVVDSYAAVGRELGLSFQIVDDILGIWGNPQVTGKSAASDILTKKKTLPVLYAFEWEKKHGHSDLRGLYARELLTEADVLVILELLGRAGAQRYAQDQGRAHLQSTLAHLEALHIDNPAQQALGQLVLDLVEREC